MTYLLLNFPLFHYEDPETGLPARDWKVYTYEAGTTTLTETYINKECDILNQNPVVLDYNGNAVIYTNKALKIILTEPDDDQNTPHLVQDYLNVPQRDIIKGTQASMTNNLYAVTSSPPQLAFEDQMMLVFTPQTDSVTTTTSHTFIGTGQNDLTWTGPYTGATSGSVFTVEITANGTPDTFRWKKDGGSWNSGVPITGIEQNLTEGIKAKFARTTGHTIGDVWALTVELPVKINLDGLGAKVVYENISGSMVAVGAGMRVGFPCEFLYSTSQSSWVWVNPAAPSLTSPAPTRVRKEVTTAYTVIMDDAGNEVAMIGDGAFTLPAAADFANQFVYLQCVGGVATITSDGTEKIYKPYDAVGATTYSVGGPLYYDTIQLQSDSIGWHVMTAVSTIPSSHGIAILDGTAWVCPPDITTVYATGNGGGGGGGATKGAGGKAGDWCLKEPITVVPGTSYDNVVGAGGNGGSGASDGDPGTATSFGTGGALLSLAGGAGGLGNGVTASAGEPSLFSKGGAVDGPQPGFGAGGGGGDADGGSDGGTGKLVLEW